MIGNNLLKNSLILMLAGLIGLFLVACAGQQTSSSNKAPALESYDDDARGIMREHKIYE